MRQQLKSSKIAPVLPLIPFTAEQASLVGPVLAASLQDTLDPDVSYGVISWPVVTLTVGDHVYKGAQFEKPPVMVPLSIPSGPLRLLREVQRPHGPLHRGPNPTRTAYALVGEVPRQRTRDIVKLTPLEVQDVGADLPTLVAQVRQALRGRELATDAQESHDLVQRAQLNVDMPPRPTRITERDLHATLGRILGDEGIQFIWQTSSDILNRATGRMVGVAKPPPRPDNGRGSKPTDPMTR